jgi:hypothetical protein
MMQLEFIFDARFMIYNPLKFEVVLHASNFVLIICTT